MKKHSEFQLGDVATFIRGINFKPADVVKLTVPNAVACMRTKNVQNELDLSDVWAVDRKFVKRDEQFLRDGDILVSSANSWNLVGKCCYIDNIPYVSSFGGFVSVIRPNPEKIIPRFLYHWFASGIIQTKIRSFGRQTTNISNLDLTRCLELPLSLPSDAEQRRIADILDKTDAIRRKRQQSLKLADDLVKSQFIEMFGDPVTNPMGWKIDYLKTFGQITTGNTPSRSENANYSTRYIEWIKTNNILNDRLHVAVAEEYLSESGAKKARIAEVGALLVACIAGSLDSIGRAALTDRKVSFNQQINAIQPHEDVNSIFLYYLFKISRKYIQSYVPKGMKRILTKGELEKIMMIKPPLEMQRRFAARVQCVEAQMEHQRCHLAEAKHLCNSLQQQFFG